MMPWAAVLSPRSPSSRPRRAPSRPTSPHRSLAAFAQFGSELDKATQQQLNRGIRLVEILKQPQYDPLPMEKQISIIYAGTRGFLDKYPVEVLADYEKQFSTFMESKFPEILGEIKEQKEFSPDLDNRMKAPLEEFDKVFQPSTAAI